MISLPTQRVADVLSRVPTSLPRLASPLLLIGLVACSGPTPSPAPPVAVHVDPVVPAEHRETAGELDWDADRVPLLVHSASSQHSTVFDGIGEFPSFPLPQGAMPAFGTPESRASFAMPLPASPVWNPSGQKRVGIQAGHWLVRDVPPELSRLSPGTSAGGWDEFEVNLLIAQHVKRILEDAGVQVDLLPTTLPPRYRSHAFISIHADGDLSGTMRGYKMARPGFSSIPDTDDKLVELLYREYGAATGLSRDSDNHISRRMTYYYAFNTRRYEHAIDLGTPAAIVETGFLTNASDRAFLTGRPDLAGQGIANAVLRFLELEIGSASTPR